MFDRLIAILVGLFFVSFVVGIGCATHHATKGGKAEYHTESGDLHIRLPDGTVIDRTGPTTRTTGEQPQNPSEPATATAMGASTGAAQHFDQALAQYAWMTYAGWALIIAGGLMLFFKSYLPLIPAKAGIFVVAAGGVMVFTPIIADRYVGPALAIVGVCGLALLVWEGWQHNWFHTQTGPEVQARLAGKGQTEAAGALAFVHSRGSKHVAKVAAAKGAK